MDLTQMTCSGSLVKSPFSQKCVFLLPLDGCTCSLTLKGCFHSHSLKSVIWKFPFTVSGLHSEVGRQSKRYSLRDFIVVTVETLKIHFYLCLNTNVNMSPAAF